jgi:hypothetical protein
LPWSRLTWNERYLQITKAARPYASRWYRDLWQDFFGCPVCDRVHLRKYLVETHPQWKPGNQKLDHWMSIVLLRWNMTEPAKVCKKTPAC